LSTGRNKLAINIAHNCVENDDSTPGLVTPGVPALTRFVNGLKKCRKEILIRRALNLSFLKVACKYPYTPYQYKIRGNRACLFGVNSYQLLCITSMYKELKYVHLTLICTNLYQRKQSMFEILVRVIIPFSIVDYEAKA
jgi:hypothetical protein